jgi:hypothetical protein
VNCSADFYPYTGEPCKSGYQLGSGNCRESDGHVPRDQCVAMAGTVELPEDVSSTGLKLQNLLSDGNSAVGLNEVIGHALLRLSCWCSLAGHLLPKDR